MSIHYNPRLSTSGLVFCLDPSNISRHGTSPYKNIGGSGSIINNQFTVVDNIFRSNADPSTGAGTSEFTFTGLDVSTGSITIQWWMKLTSNPNVGTANNWRRLIDRNTGGRNPFGFVLEQSGVINFTITTTSGTKRYIDGVFAASSSDLNVWQMHTFTYDRNTGTSSCYRNETLLRSGPQTGTSGGGSPTVPGESILSILPTYSFDISNSRNVSNPNGDGCLPCDLGPWMIYDKALTQQEVNRNFSFFRTRYGV